MCHGSALSIARYIALQESSPNDRHLPTPLQCDTSRRLHYALVVACPIQRLSSIRHQHRCVLLDPFQAEKEVPFPCTSNDSCLPDQVRSYRTTYCSIRES